MSYVIFGLNVPLLGKNRTSLVKSHMCGKNHTCEEFTTQEDVLEVVG